MACTKLFELFDKSYLINWSYSRTKKGEIQDVVNFSGIFSQTYEAELFDKLLMSETLIANTYLCILFFFCEQSTGS